MNREQIDKVINTCSVPDSCEDIGEVETYRSWIILADNFVYKINKPRKIFDADYSTLEKRKEHCEKELSLNTPLAGNVYEKIITVRDIKDEDNEGEIIDYALVMKKLDGNRNLNFNLKNNTVTRDDINSITEKISWFHNNSPSRKEFFQPEFLKNRIIKLSTKEIENYLVDNFGLEHLVNFHNGTKKAIAFIDNNKELFRERAEKGFIKDGHGNLRSKKIFLYRQPVIIDRVEYDDNLRHTDVLEDLATLGLDFDFHKRYDQCDYMLASYMDKYDNILDDKLVDLFVFYKLKRTLLKITKMIHNTLAGNGKMQEFKMLRYLKLSLWYQKQLI